MDGRRIIDRTVVVPFMAFHTDPTIEPGHDRPVLGYVGTGRALVYSESQVVAATWSKPSELAPTRILGPDGQELPFVRGRIFMQVVLLGTRIAEH